LVAATVGALLGCGGSTASDATGSQNPAPDSGAAYEDAAQSDGGAGDDAMATEAGPDEGAPSTTYPAFKPDFGQIIKNNGYVMHAPVVVPVTWNSDPSQASFDAFADGLGASTYWQTITKDYDIGPATSGAANHAHMTTAAPATVTESMDVNSDLVKLVTANAGTTWPAPTTDTIYAIFLPPGTSLLLPVGGPGSQLVDACRQGIGGYHFSTALSTQANVAYAVVPSCSAGSQMVTMEESTLSMSHEIIETATDPFSDGALANAGWYGFDTEHLGFDVFNEVQVEVGDTCEFYREAFYLGDSTFPFALQRIWSNSSAAAGHHPCVPVPSGSYFNVTPLDLTEVKVNRVPQLGVPSASMTKGVRVMAGQSGTFSVGFYSDGPTSGPWTITAVGGNPLAARGGQDILAMYNPSSLTATIDKTSGQNGEIAHITVSVTTTGSLFKGEILTITSTLNRVSHYMPVWIGGE
jgi:hypothetical protein